MGTSIRTLNTLTSRYMSFYKSWKLHLFVTLSKSQKVMLQGLQEPLDSKEQRLLRKYKSTESKLASANAMNLLN